jgi:hemolysin-activating ACP:hemolysin acyltransferase
MREALKSRSHLTVVKQNPRITTLQATCPDCGIVNEFVVSSPSLQMWVRGDLIQDAFPELTADQREQFITGYCDPCWQKMWAYLNDEENGND